MKRIVLVSLFLSFSFSSPLALSKTGPRTVELRLSTKGNDIAFDKKSVEIPYASEVKITFINEAVRDSQILHNIAILVPGSTEEVIKELQATGYDVEKMRSNKNVLGMTPPIDPGEKSSLTFNPKARGFYPYICLMAGHGDMLEMRGILHLK